MNKPLMTKTQKEVRQEVQKKFEKGMETLEKEFSITTDPNSKWGREIEHVPTPEKVLAFLKGIGVTKAEIYFYGGHDSGDVSEFKYYVNEFEFDQSLLEDVQSYTVISRENRRDLTFEEALVDPIWNQYGSFAGDWSCEGKLIYDTDQMTVVIDGSEYQTVGEPVSYNCLDPDNIGARQRIEEMLAALNLNN